MSVCVSLPDAPFDPAEILRDFVAENHEYGAVSSFIGAVRGENGGIRALYLESYGDMTRQSVRAIGDAASARFDLSAITIIHRTGMIDAGEAIVFVAAAARHRRAAIDAVDYAMDRLKTEALLWKREEGPSGARWIEPRDDDHTARARWD